MPGVDALMDLIAQDKKVKRGKLTFILVRGIGQAFVENDVDAAEVRAFLADKLPVSDDHERLALARYCLDLSAAVGFLRRQRDGAHRLFARQHGAAGKAGQPPSRHRQSPARERERLLGALLLGNNAVNIAASALATGVLLAWFGKAGMLYATIGMTAVVVIFSEVLPKTAAFNAPDRIALLVARPMLWVVKLLGPVLMGIELLVRLLLRLFGMHVGENQPVLSPHEELRGAVDLLHREGGVEKLDRDMFGGVLDLRELDVSDVMVHRTNMISMKVDDPAEEVVDAVIASPVTRIPFWRDNPENIVGVLHVKDLLRALHAVDGDADKVDIAALLTPPWFVPDTRPVSEQLKAFRRRKTPFALVVDEYGEVEGLVTLEDILEEIVGDITDEHDVAMPGVRRQPDGSVIVEGAVSIRDLEPRHGLEPAGRGGHHHRRPGHPRGALDPRGGAELHLPRLPLPGAAPRAQPHHLAAHPAAAAQQPAKVS